MKANAEGIYIIYIYDLMKGAITSGYSVTNLGVQTANTQHLFYEYEENPSYQFGDELFPGETKIYDLEDIDVVDGFWGYVLVASDQPITGTIALVPNPPDYLTIEGPESGKTFTEYSFTVTVYPDFVTTPITYTWATEDTLIISVSTILTDTQEFQWTTIGTKTLSVTAENSEGYFSRSTQIDIGEHGGENIFLPLVTK